MRWPSVRVTISYVLLATVIGAGLVIFVVFPKCRGRAPANCRDRLCKLGRIACRSYMDRFGEQKFYPKSLDELRTKGVVAPVAFWIFRCPDDRNPVRRPDGTLSSYECMFDIVPNRLTDDIPGDLPMIWDKKGNHRNGRNVCFVDTYIEFVSEKDFQQMIAELKKNDALKKAMER